MASSEKVNYSIVPVAGTVNDRALILYVRESYFKATTTLVRGTTLTNFMSTEGIPKGDAITEGGFGNYIYQEQLDKSGNQLRFLFLKNKTPAERLEVVKPAFTINQVTDWPDWLLSLYMLDATVELQSETNTSFLTNNVTGQRYFDRYILIRGGNYNTKHVVEEFFSPDPISTLVATEPRPDLVFYNYFGVNNQLNCIHDTITIPEPYLSADLVEDFGTPNTQEVDWPQGSIFPATNHTAWITHYRILQVTERDGGYYYRRHQVLPPRIPRAIQI